MLYLGDRLNFSLFAQIYPFQFPGVMYNGGPTSSCQKSLTITRHRTNWGGGWEERETERERQGQKRDLETETESKKN